jgi:hypothetical protein
LRQWGRGKWSHDKGTDRVTFPIALKVGVDGSLLCYICAPDGVSNELIQVPERCFNNPFTLSDLTEVTL